MASYLDLNAWRQGLGGMSRHDLFNLGPTGTGTFAGWTPPNGSPYGPWSAPGYGTSMDPEDAGFNLFADARAWLGKNPQIFDPYSGQMTAGLSPLFSDAAAIGERIGSFTPTRVAPGSFPTGNLGAYMNPYTSNVIDTTLQDIDRSRQIANQAGARSAGASTYGGDRNALIEAETNRGYADIAARTAAQLRSQGFDTAAGLMSQDLNRSLTAQLANQQALLDAGRLNLAGGGFLSGLGTQEQATNQAELTNRYNEYLRSVYGPLEGYNFLGGLLSGNPYATPGGPSKAAGFLGGAATGAAIGSVIPGLGTGLGALGGGLIGLFA